MRALYAIVAMAMIGLSSSARQIAWSGMFSFIPLRIDGDIDNYQYIIDGNVNVRSSPSKQGSVYTQLQAGNNV